MKIEEGEKYLMLKKRFYPNFEDDEIPKVRKKMRNNYDFKMHPQKIVQVSTRRPSGENPSAPPPPSRRGPPPQSSSPSLLDEVMANFQPLSATLALSSSSSSGYGPR